jgi:serine/threonine protein kinase
MLMHAQSPPPALASKAKQPIPPRLEALVMACLAKDPAKRPGDADVLSVALGAALDDEPWSAVEARAWWDTHPVAP